MTVLDYYTFMVLMDRWFILYHRGTTIESPLGIFRSYNSSHIGHYRSVVAGIKREEEGSYFAEEQREHRL